jgi:hypothetical protein
VWSVSGVCDMAVYLSSLIEIMNVPRRSRRGDAQHRRAIRSD